MNFDLLPQSGEMVLAIVAGALVVLGILIVTIIIIKNKKNKKDK